MTILSRENLSRKKISIIIILIFLISLIIIGGKLTKAGDPASWDLLDEDCAGISDWVDDDNGTGVSEVSPAGQFRFDTNTGAAGNAFARRDRDIGSLPNTFTVEVKLYHDAIGIKTNNDNLKLVFNQSDEYAGLSFASDGLWIYDEDNPGWAKVGTDLVKHGGSAEWQTWRFLVTFTETTGNGTCDIYLNDSTHDWEKVGINIPCSRETSPLTDGEVEIGQFGYITDNRISHIDYIKIAAGLYAPNLVNLKSAGSVIKTDIKSIGGVNIGDIKSVGGIE